MRQYLDLLKDVLDNGIEKGPARAGMPCTKEVFCRSMRFDLSKGFPLITTKKMFTKGIVSELLWFLKGDTNIKYLLNNGNKIWIDDAYKLYRRKGGSYTKKEWLAKVEDDALESVLLKNKELETLTITYTGSRFGECGEIYGKQWRKFGNNNFDQVAHLIQSLKERPNERYHIISAWDPNSYLNDGTTAALPACHVFWQFSVREGKLDLMMLQRSCDMLLGVPFDLAMCGLMCHLVAQTVGLEPGEFIWVGNSCHIYENHIEQVKEQLTREPLPLCSVKINHKDSIFDYEISDISFINYSHHPAIKAPLSVGL